MVFLAGFFAGGNSLGVYRVRGRSDQAASGWRAGPYAERSMNPNVV